MSLAVRPLAALFASICSFALSAFLVGEGFLTATASKQNLQVRHRGAVYEDVFGFGFWPTWAVLLAAQLLLLAIAWQCASRSTRRPALVLLALAFAGATVVQYFAFSREFALWSQR